MELNFHCDLKFQPNFCVLKFPPNLLKFLNYLNRDFKFLAREKQMHNREIHGASATNPKFNHATTKGQVLSRSQPKLKNTILSLEVPLKKKKKKLDIIFSKKKHVRDKSVNPQPTLPTLHYIIRIQPISIIESPGSNFGTGYKTTT